MALRDRLASALAAALVVLIVLTVLTGCSGDAGSDAGAPAAPSAYERAWTSARIAGADVRGAGDIQVSDDLTVMTALRGSDGEGQLVGVDTRTGAERWRLTVDAELPGSEARLYDSSTFVVSGDAVLVPVWVRDQAGIAAVSAVHGFVMWMSLRADRFSAPTVTGATGGTVVWNHEDYDTGAAETVAVSAETGAEVWSRSGVQALAVSGRYVVAQTPPAVEGELGRPEVLALADGRTRWVAPRRTSVEAVSGGWLFAEDLLSGRDTGAGAYRLADGRFVPAKDGLVGLESDLDRVVAMGDGLVWSGRITSTQTYQVLPDRASRPRRLDVGFDASLTPYTLVGDRVLAAAKGQRPGTVAYDLQGRRTGEPLPGWLVGVYGTQGRHLVTVLGRDPGAEVAVYRRAG